LNDQRDGLRYDVGVENDRDSARKWVLTRKRKPACLGKNRQCLEGDGGAAAEFFSV